MDFYLFRLLYSVVTSKLLFKDDLVSKKTLIFKCLVSEPLRLTCYQWPPPEPNSFEHWHLYLFSLWTSRLMTEIVLGYASSANGAGFKRDRSWKSPIDDFGCFRRSCWFIVKNNILSNKAKFKRRIFSLLTNPINK